MGVVRSKGLMGSRTGSEQGGDWELSSGQKRHFRGSWWERTKGKLPGTTVAHLLLGTVKYRELRTQGGGWWGLRATFLSRSPAQTHAASFPGSAACLVASGSSISEHYYHVSWEPTSGLLYGGERMKPTQQQQNNTPTPHEPACRGAFQTMKESDSKRNNQHIHQGKHGFTPGRSYVYGTMWQELKSVCSGWSEGKNEDITSKLKNNYRTKPSRFLRVAELAVRHGKGINIYRLKAGTRPSFLHDAVCPWRWFT